MTKKTELIKRIQDCKIPVYIRFGLGWKGATWSQTTKENLVRVLNEGKYAHYDVCNIRDGLGISFYSASDMW